jgi:segregation and condensation protein A
MAITVLEPFNDVGRCMFTKAPEPLKRDTTYRYQHAPEDLLRALTDISERGQRRLPPPTANFKGIVGKEPYPVTKKAGELVRNLVLRGVQKLKSLFNGSRTRSEIVATFLAILELCKTNTVSLEADTSGENPDVRLVDESKLMTQGDEINGTD